MSSTATLEAIELVELTPRKTNDIQPRESSLQLVGRLDEAGRTISQNGESQSGISRWRAALLVINISSITLVNTMLSGLLIVGLPSMARDLALPANLLLWPASVNTLACGCTLLIAGSISDVVGGRLIYLIGNLFLAITTAACGLSRTGIQLILFRAIQGLASSLCLPASVILITSNLPTGKPRNIAFACLGAGQPVGFSIGLFLGGLFVESIGWRWGYYIGAILTFIIFLVSIFALPVDNQVREPVTLRALRTKIDWLGCGILSTSLGLFSYVFSVLSARTSSFLEPTSLVLFVAAVLLLPIFGLYVRHQEKNNRVAIIPPSLWKNGVFTCICIVVFVTCGTFSAIQYFLTLFFQDIQSLSPIQTSLRFLPMIVIGTMTNFITGALVQRIPANYLLLISAILSAPSPLLLAIIDPSWNYFACAFIAIFVFPISMDVLFTVSNLLITTVFHPEKHGIAGGVFNTMDMIGSSVGLAIAAVIASSVTMEKEKIKGEGGTHALLAGYKAMFWTCFALNVAMLGVIGWGLRRIGKVGRKMD